MRSVDRYFPVVAARHAGPRGQRCGSSSSRRRRVVCAEQQRDSERRIPSDCEGTGRLNAAITSSSYAAAGSCSFPTRRRIARRPPPPRRWLRAAMATTPEATMTEASARGCARRSTRSTSTATARCAQPRARSRGPWCRGGGGGDHCEPRRRATRETSRNRRFLVFLPATVANRGGDHCLALFFGVDVVVT